ncbi:hypothetical protein EOL96_04035 [Candidatus Saccharibacteria bacterium]|nr:hypothetical protein [Candidatus Saccharibacteria bacterium]
MEATLTRAQMREIERQSAKEIKRAEKEAERKQDLPYLLLVAFFNTLFFGDGALLWALTVLGVESVSDSGFPSACPVMWTSLGGIVLAAVLIVRAQNTPAQE